MKLAKFTKLLVFALIITVAAVGCRKSPTGLTKLPGAKAGQVPDVPPGTGIDDKSKLGAQELTGTPITDPSVFDKYDKDAEIFKAYTVHFDFDSSVVKANDKVNVTAVGDHMKANAAQALEIDGHCDERGTEEYNRSLGERRALAVREELIQMGVDPKRVITKSFGEDRPVDPGHDESAWKKNRRGEFILLTPPK